MLVTGIKLSIEDQAWKQAAIAAPVPSQYFRRYCSIRNWTRRNLVPAASWVHVAAGRTCSSKHGMLRMVGP